VKKTKRLLGKILIEMGVITKEQLMAALRLQMEHCLKLLGQILIEMEIATYAQVAEALKRQDGW